MPVEILCFHLAANHRYRGRVRWDKNKFVFFFFSVLVVALRIELFFSSLILIPVIKVNFRLN